MTTATYEVKTLEGVCKTTVYIAATRSGGIVARLYEKSFRLPGQARVYADSLRARIVNGTV